MKAFCDVDENKIQKGFYTYEESKVSHFSSLALMQSYVISLYMLSYRSIITVSAGNILKSMQKSD